MDDDLNDVEHGKKIFNLFVISAETFKILDLTNFIQNLTQNQTIKGI